MSLHTLIATCLGERDALALAREQAARWETWLVPVSPVSEVGHDPGYDDDFQRMREEVNKLSGVDTDQVIQLAEKLLKHTCKDLRVVTYYVWARLHKEGETGLADGLSLLAALIERYATNVLPERANSRKMALEWLTGSKVLDSLSMCSEVSRETARRTIAALAWLEHGLGRWAEDQRPALGALYTALSARLTQAGGTTQTIAQPGAKAASDGLKAVPTLTAIRSGRDLLDGGRTLAGYLREQPQGWLAAHRLMKCLRWDTVHQAPPQQACGNTRLAPPRGDYRVQLKRLYRQQSWSELLDQIERMFAEGVNHFWLDLQWYLYQVLSRQPAPQDSWANSLLGDLAMFLERLPGVEELCWSDGTPFADETTREWIVQEVSDTRRQQPLMPVAAPVIEPGILSLESEAFALADSDGVDQALAWLSVRPGVTSGRQRWLLRLLMARVAEQYGRIEFAVHLLTELDATAQRRGLMVWEPDLDFEVKARLLKLLRLKAQRNDVDKPTLARRTEALLAGLVAIDPVRAAVLCP